MTRLIVEPARDLPVVWFSVSFSGGSSCDPRGLEGLQRHAGELSRRGAGDRTRTQIDEAVDSLGAALGVSTSRDAMTLWGMCLSRNLDPLIEIACDVLGNPTMAQNEHEQLLRETQSELDEMLDDDATVAARHFEHHGLPGYPYSRTTVGTKSSLQTIRLDDAVRELELTISSATATIGFAGDLSPERARALSDRLLARIPKRPARALPQLEPTPPRPPGRRVFLVDKPERTQSQILIGQLGPRYGSDDWLALLPVEATFGGMFSSRLTQQIRVARGWSYGAGCNMLGARGPHWFRMHLAPSAEVTLDALELTLTMFDDLCERSISDDELDFAVRYLTGSLPFSRATARQRMQEALQLTLYGLPLGLPQTLPAKLASLDRQQTLAAIQRWFTPDDLCIVVVATASEMLPRLKAHSVRAHLGEIQVVAYDAY